jgi:hypothetical protein
LGFLPVALILCCNAAVAQVRITEFMASNTHTLADEDGDFSDWIEIQNTSGTNVNLFNWSLTDSAGNPTKWLFPSTNIAPGSFMVIFASGKDRRIPGQELHTNFKLSADGEYLALFRPVLLSEVRQPVQPLRAVMQTGPQKQRFTAIGWRCPRDHRHQQHPIRALMQPQTQRVFLVAHKPAALASLDRSAPQRGSAR